MGGVEQAKDEYSVLVRDLMTEYNELAALRLAMKEAQREESVTRERTTMLKNQLSGSKKRIAELQAKLDVMEPQL